MVEIYHRKYARSLMDLVARYMAEAICEGQEAKAADLLDKYRWLKKIAEGASDG